MLGSNDYLGLTGDERVKQGARDALDKYGTGLTGSRFLNGTIDLHVELEHELAEWLGTGSAIVFTTGHQANMGVLGTILGPGDTVVVDSGDHGSILDGCVLAKAKVRSFRHNRLDRLEHALKRAAHDRGGVLVVVDGVFSMEGDIAPAAGDRGLVRTLRRPADGRRGARARRIRPARSGVCELFGVEDRVDLRMATFSKALASCGGVIAGPADVIDYLRIQSRPFIFTASAVPAAVGAALASVRICRSEEGRQLFTQVLDNARYLHAGLQELGFRVVEPTKLADGTEVITPVVPIFIGDEMQTVMLWNLLYEAGLFVNVAIFPAVPLSGALLRTSVMASHDRDTLDRALSIFADVKRVFETHQRATARSQAVATQLSGYPLRVAQPP